jgi:hypothetical protein
MRVADVAIDEKNFERLALRVCDQVFQYEKKRTNFLVEGIEHDAEYNAEFDIHVVEITVSKKEIKPRMISKKLKRGCNSLRETTLTERRFVAGLLRDTNLPQSNMKSLSSFQ